MCSTESKVGAINKTLSRISSESYETDTSVMSTPPNSPALKPKPKAKRIRVMSDMSGMINGDKKV